MARFALNPFTKQLDIVDVGGAAGPIQTLSAEGGTATAPSGSNFNFSGSVSGGAAANGAILFSTPSNGELDGKVQVDGITIIINSSNQLEAISSVTWVLQTADLMAVKGFGYFTNSATAPPTGLQITLPLVSAVGDQFEVYNFNGNGFTILLNAGQTIRLGTKTTTVTIGSVVSLALGDTLTLTCAVANTVWAVTQKDGDLQVN